MVPKLQKKQILDLRKPLMIKPLLKLVLRSRGIEVAKNRMNLIRHKLDKNRKNKAELDSRRKKLLKCLIYS